MTRSLAVAVVLGAAALAACQNLPFGSGQPRFAVDPYWPKPLPVNWILGHEPEPVAVAPVAAAE